MATRTWIGNSSLHPDPNDATDPLNWVGGFVPSAGDVIVMNAGSLGAGVTLDLIGQPGTIHTLSGNIFQIAGPFDVLALSNTSITSTTITAGNGAAPGQGFVLNLTDSLADAFGITVGNNATLNLSGSTATALHISGDSNQSMVHQSGSGSALVINATGTVSVGAQLWADSLGGHTTYTINQTNSLTPGFFSLDGPILNVGGTVTVNADANIKSRLSNNGYILTYGGTAAALTTLNARMNGISGELNLLGGANTATLDVHTNMPGAQIINFGDAKGLLKVATATALSSDFNVAGTITTVGQNFFSRISGFKAGDTIDLVGLNPAGLTYSFGNDANYGNDVLLINSGTTTVARLRFLAENLVAGTGTIDGAATGNFQLTSQGGDTLVTLANSQIAPGTTIAVTGTLAQWGGLVNGGTTDWSAARWTAGSGVGGLPGQYQATQLSLTAAQADIIHAGTFTPYVLSVTTAETAGSVSIDDPLARLLITAPLTLAAVPGQGTGGGFASNQGRVEIHAGGTLTTSRLYVGAGTDFKMFPSGQLSVSGAAPFTLGAGLAGIDEEGNGDIQGGTISSTGYTAIGLIGNGSIGISNDIISNDGTTIVYGTHGSTVVDTYTQIGGFALTGANQPLASLNINGPNTTWTDIGGDASTPFSGALIVGGGNLSVNGLGQLVFPSGGNGRVSISNGATVTDASYAMLGASRGSSGTVELFGGAHWNIGLGAVTPTPSIVVGNTITGTATLYSSGLPWLSVGSGGTGSLTVDASVVQLGTGELFNTAKMIVGTGNSGNNTATGTVDVHNGALLDTGGGPLIVGQRSAGTLMISNSSTVHVGAASATTAIGFGLSIGNRSGTVGPSSGLVVVNSGGVLIDDGDLVVGRDSVGTLTLSGGIANVSGGVYLGGLRALNNGTIAITPTLVKGAASGTIAVTSGTLTASAGTIDIWQGSTLSLSGSGGVVVGTLTPASGMMVIASGAILQGAGLITITSGSSGLLNLGTVLAGGLTSSGAPSQNGATLEISAVLSGSGTFALSPNSVLQLDNGVVNTSSFDFGVGNLGTAPTAPEMIRTLSPLSFQGTISHFYGLGASNNRLDLVGAGYTGGNPTSYVPNGDPTTGGAVTVTTASGSVTFHVTGLHPSGFAATADGAGTGTIVFANDAAPCFLAGTRILTISGEVPVEALRPGDRVPAALGARLRRVIWVGSTRVDLDRHPEPGKVAPICIHAGAFAPGVPHRDLLVSPDHAIWTGDALVPAYLLVNAATITRAPAAGIVTYVHVELDAHDVLLAEGLPAESYLDTGNRALFAGVAGVRPANADLLADLSARAWDERACAMLALGGAPVTNAHQRLAARAAQLGHRLTDDPALVITADDTVLAYHRTAVDRIAVTVPAGVMRLNLRSRSTIAQDLDPTRNDRRRLGIALAKVRLSGTILPLLPALCANGFHAPECHGETSWRWTDGDATLHLPLSHRKRHLELSLVSGMIVYRTSRPGAAAGHAEGDAALQQQARAVAAG